MIELRISAGMQRALRRERNRPELAIPWTGRPREFFSSVLALIRGPAAPKKFAGAPYFRDCWIYQRSPKIPFLVAVACQMLLTLFPPPIWNIRQAQVEAF